MKIAQLRYFYEACKTGSFSAASKNLFVTQPAVAQAIRDLEKEYGVMLFARDNNKLTLTSAGEWLYAHTQNFLDTADDFDREFRSVISSNSIIRIGVGPLLGNLYFYSVFNELSLQKKELNFDIQEAGSRDIRRMAQDNDIDFGLCILDGIDEEKLNYHKFFDAQLKFCVHRSHPLAAHSELTFEDLRNCRICLLREDSYQNQYIKSQFAAAGVPIDVLMYSGHLNSILTMLGYGSCGAFLFEDAVALREDIVALPMKQPLTLAIGLVWNKRQPSYLGLQTIRKLLISKCGQLVSK